MSSDRYQAAKEILQLIDACRTDHDVALFMICATLCSSQCSCHRVLDASAVVPVHTAVSRVCVARACLVTTGYEHLNYTVVLLCISAHVFTSDG